MRRIAAIAGLVVGVSLFVGGCGQKESKTGSDAALLNIGKVKKDGEPLLTIDGVVEMTVDEFKNELAVAGGGAFASMMLPPAAQRQFLDNFIEFRMQAKAAIMSGVEKDEEFKRLFAEQVARIRDALLVMVFRKKLLETEEVDEEDLKKEYEKNKFRYIAKHGGTKCVAVEFESKEAAERFLDKVKRVPEKFAEYAKSEKGGLFKELGYVPDNEDIPSLVPTSVIPKIREAKLGEPFLTEAAGAFWVVYPMDRRDTKYYDLDEIRDVVERQLKEQRVVKKLKAEIEKMKAQSKIIVNDDYFKKLEEEMKKLQEEEEAKLREKMENAGKVEKKQDEKKE